MKRTLLLTLATIFMAVGGSADAAEIKVQWINTVSASQVYDIKFMKDSNTFFLGDGYRLQVRSCEDGSLISEHPPFPADSLATMLIEYNADSTRLIGTRTNIIQIIDLNDYSVIKSDTISPLYEASKVSFDAIQVDPVRPYVYGIVKDWNFMPPYQSTVKIIKFDIETLEPVETLLVGESITNLAISIDGKYLAALTAISGKLYVWNLQTEEKIIEQYIKSESSNEDAEPWDLKFSEKNTDILYFSGLFWQKFGEQHIVGLTVYSVKESKIIDDTFSYGQSNSYLNLFTFFENGNKIFCYGGGFITVINTIIPNVEYHRFNNIIIGGSNCNYNKDKKLFISSGDYSFTGFKYDSNTGIEDITPQETIYPNPTSGIVNIPIQCEGDISYEIYSSAGQLIDSKQNILANEIITIDFTSYSSGKYFVKMVCGSTINYYQVLR